MHKKTYSRVLSFLLACIMVFSLLPLTALASEKKEDEAPADPIDVNVTFQYENSFLTPLLPGNTISVTPGIAEQYGYQNDAALITDAAVSVLDVLVAAHIAALGGDELLPDCLVVSETGYITTAMGEATTAFGFLVNSKMPHGLEWRSEDVEYLGYSCNQAIVSDGDTVDFFYYTDDVYFTDYFTWFEQKGAKLDEITADAGQAFDVCLSGYIAMFGLYTDEIKADFTEPVADAQIGIVDLSTGAIMPISGAVTDDDGIASITIAEPGTYILSAIGDEWVPVISPYVTVVVSGAPADTSVTFAVSPAGAVVSLYDAAGKRVMPDSEGKFTDLTVDAAYTYTVSKNGCIGVKDSFLYTGGAIIRVTLNPVPESTLTVFDSAWPSFRGNSNNMGITSGRTATTTDEATLLWRYKPASYSNNQIIVDDYVFINSGTKIFKINKNTGVLAATADMLGAPSFNIVPMTYAEGMVFANINNGRIQAFNAETLESLWVSEQLNGQCLNHIVYDNGYVYTGFWQSETADQHYVCIPVADEDPTNPFEVKTVQWRFTVPGGFYWVGGLVRGDSIVFGSDDGKAGSNNPSKLYSVDKVSGALIDSIDTVGDLRSAIAYDAQTDRLYFTSKGGYVYSVRQNSDGTFAADSLTSYQFEAGWEVTATPVVHNGRLYIGTGKGFGTGKLVVMNAETLTPIYDTGTALTGYPQGSPLLSTAYEAKTGKVYIYTTYNSNPGGLAMIEDSAGQTELVFTNLFTPDSKQFCLSSPIADSDGNIYYHNDSGYVFKLSAAPEALPEDPVTLPELPSDWNSARGNRQNMGVVNAETPTSADNAELLWCIKYGSGYFDTPNTPVIVEGCLIFAAGSKIFKVDRTNGAILAQNSMVSSPSFNISSVTYGGGMVFTTVSNGRIQAFNADTLESLWVSEPLGGQSLSHIVYADGYVYTGFWTGEAKDNYYVCMSVTDEDPGSDTEVKKVLWKHTVTGGFYWTGGVVVGDYIVFGSDNGTTAKEDLSRLYSLNRVTGEVIDTCEGVIGDQRSGIAYDAATDALYFTSKAGYVGRTKLDKETGRFINGSLIVRQMNTGWEATGTPVVHGGILFVGTGAGVGGGGKLVAANAETLEILDSVSLIAYPQGSPLLSTAYEQATGKLYLYISYNKTPGGLTVAEYDIATKKLSASELFTPPSGTQNYCIDSVICDTDGTLYYHNDSTYLFAIGKKAAEPEPETLITEVKAQRSSTNITLSPDGAGSYKATVDNSYSSVDILVSVIAGASVTVNGQAPVNGKVNIALTAGVVTTVTIIATKDVKTETVTLSITRKAAPENPGGEDGQFGKKIGTVSVSVRNDTYPGGAFTGLIFSSPSFTLYANDTMMTVVLRALKANGYSWTGTGGDGSAEDYKIAYLAYIQKDGKLLGEFGGEAGSGWMGLLNDFFVNEGFQQFIPEDGDEISIEYTQNLGVDLGGNWGNTNTALQSLDFSTGTLTPAFKPATYEYILTLPAGSTTVKAAPRAYNRNFLVKTFLNEKVTSNSEVSSFYKRTAYIPVKAGDTIYIGVGEPAWPSMNNQGSEASDYAATWYRVKINIEGSPTGNTPLPKGTETVGDGEIPLGGLPEIEVVELPAAIKDNAMTVTITGELATALLDNAAQNESFFTEKTVVIKMPKTDTAGITTYKAVIAAKELAACKDSAIFICTPAGNVICPASLVNKLIAEGKDLIITVEKGSMIVRATLGDAEVQPKDYGDSVRLEIPMELNDTQNSDMAVMVKVTGDTKKIMGTSYFRSGFVIANVAETGKYDTLYNEKSFTDTTGKWMDKAVIYMASRDIISGVGNNRYDPNRAITRAEFTSLLVRTLEAMGIELKAEGQNFSDVAADKWYSDVIRKAHTAGWVSGVGDNRFAPDTTINRQDMFTMLYRAMEKYGLLSKYSKREAVVFTDSALIDDYAKGAVDVLTSCGLISGKGNELVAPKDISTRGECAQVLYNILNKK